MKRKYHSYRLLRASGELEDIRMPVAFDAADLAAKFKHSEVFLFVSQGSDVVGTSDINVVRFTGPCWVWWDREHSTFRRVLEPKTEGDAYQAIKEAV